MNKDSVLSMAKFDDAGLIEVHNISADGENH